MSKRTIALIILLVIVTGGLLYVGSASQQKAPVPQAVVTKPVFVGHTILSLVPSTSVPNSVDITINTNGDNSTAAQAEITYDPKVLTNVHITQGSFYDSPVVLFNTIDPKNGRISYAEGIRPESAPKKGTGIVATITYSVVPGATGSTALTFLPKTKVTAEGIAPSVLKIANSVTIPVK